MDTMNEISQLIVRIEYFSGLAEMLLCMYFASAFMDQRTDNFPFQVCRTISNGMDRFLSWLRMRIFRLTDGKSVSVPKQVSKVEHGSAFLHIVFAFILGIAANMIFFEHREWFAFSYQKRLFFFALCVIVQWLYFRRKYVLSIVATIIYGEIAMSVKLVVEIACESTSGLLHKKEAAELLWSILIITVVVLVAHGLVPKEKISPAYLLAACVITLFSVLCNWLMIGAEGMIPSTQKFTEFFMLAILIIFFAFQIVMVFFVLKIAETHQQKQTNALIELNNKMLQRSLDETEQTFELWRQSVHDYKNHMIVLQQMAEEQRLDEIQTFLQQENDSIQKRLFLIRTGNSVADTIVNLKHSLAEKHRITFLVHGTLPTKLVLTDMDLANILGNLLDNAIEASQKEQEPYIALTFRQEKNFLLINICNKCTDMQRQELGKSSKEHPEFHGIGLKSVMRTVKKYDGEMTIEQTELEYIVNIMVLNLQ